MSMDVVVGVDGSENSVAALRWAAAYAKLTGATVRAITTWEYPAFADTTGMVTMPGPDFFVGGAEATLDGALGQAALPYDVKVIREIVEGHPAHTLLERSRDAALLVVGRRGHSGIVGAFTGSVANACANHAEVPVVIVPVTAEM
jgi:nucleotide-binding universal stress UspA family protein